MRPEVQLTSAPWQFPAPTVLDLPNGLTIWHFPMPGQQVAAFEILQPIRLTDEPRAIEGVGSVACRALDEQSVSHPDIQELLDASGAALHGGAEPFSTRIGGIVPARRLQQLAPLVVELLTEPAYAADDLARAVEAFEAAHHSRKASTNSAARWAFRQTAHALGDRYGRPFTGTPSTLAMIQRENVLTWHSRHFAPTAATLVVAGDVDDLALDAWTAWQGTATRHPIVPPQSATPQMVVVDVPGAVQTTIILGRRSIPRTDPRWAPARLAGHVLAGAFASRLNLELRERLGYTYGVDGGFRPDPVGSTLQVATNTRTEVAGEVVRRMLAGLALEKPITEDELADAKAFRIGIAPLANETSADIAAQAATLTESGLTTAFVNEHAAALAACSTDEATTAWRELVPVDELVIAVAGDAASLMPQLSQWQPTALSLD